MKKLISILLTLALTLSLSAPALAAAPEEAPLPDLIDPPLPVEDTLVIRDSGYPMDAETVAWLEAHPEEAAAMEAAIDTYVQETWYYDSVAEMAEYWGESEAYIRDMLLEEQVWAAMVQEEEQAAQAEYAAAHPGYLDGFDPDAWLRTAYPDYRDPEEAFMADYDLADRAAFEAYMKADYTNHLIRMENLRSERDAALAEAPAALDGFDVDDYFTQEYPYYSDQEEFMADYGLLDRTEFETYLTWEYLIYYAAPEGNDPWTDDLKEALGGVPGELGIMVNGTYLTFTGDKPYAEDGVTYVPAAELGEALGLELTGDYVTLREMAQAAGCEIWWDQAYETAVVIDPDVLVAAIDSGFTALNGVLAKNTLDWERWAESEDWNVTLTMFDTLNGDKTYPMTLTQESLYGPEGLQTTGEYDLSALMTLLEQMGLLEYVGEDELKVVSAVLSGDYELRWDTETGAMAFTASCLPDLLSMMGTPYPKDLWFTMDGETTEELSTLFSDLMDQEEPVTVGDLVWYLYASTTAPWSDPVLYWSEATELAAGMSIFLGDDALVREGDAWVLRLGMSELAGLLGYSEEDYDYLGLQDFALECAFGDDGTVTGSLLCLTPDESWSPAMRIAADWKFDLTSGRLEAELHLKNQMKLTITTSTALEETGEKPETQVPEGAASMALEDLTGW
ncbi:hypothetical protein [Intestinimonas timonensis]|uniref:hypothetical protein n=1 Tax=Intestinimonas timonensis TaxID=1689270 RepID=UPI00102FD9E8|nr:hypothetical protein [Intestinimonas timonensis]